MAETSLSELMKTSKQICISTHHIKYGDINLHQRIPPHSLKDGLLDCSKKLESNAKWRTKNYWTKERVQESAIKFMTKSDWYNADNQAYHASKRLGVRYQVTRHMPNRAAIQSKWSDNERVFSEAAQFRDWCIEQGMGIKRMERVFASVRAIINLAISEEGFDCSNAFAKTCLLNDDNAQSRQPISVEDVRKVQSLCRDTDDEMRWLIALVSNTGMRLGEAAGLLNEDIKLD